ncbi:MAG: metallophosphoesterase [Candidatus Lokiarchaeota archaeon]|nr:metallophosphoesterase [Candidatus Lokiarchaeota archaeon]
MNVKNIEEKKIILRRLVNSGINITPSLLEFILTLDDPLQKVNLIIKDSSFIASFKSHLTENILNKISNEEIKRVVKRKFVNPEAYSSENNLDKNDNDNSHPPKILVDSTNSDIESNFITATETSPPKTSNSGISTHLPPNIENNEYTNNLVENQKTRIKSIEGAKSTRFFTPIAKDFDFQLEILKDPTGKLYTNGEYKDFYDFTFDKFNRLRKLMRKRPEVHAADNINNILRLSNKVEVSVIGLVTTIRKTKNGNYILNIEDLTGSINVLIKIGSDNQDNLNIKIAERTLSDQMVYIEGTYNPGENRKSSIIYGNFISKIDTPRDFEPNISSEPLSLALISDTHIGSKEFESRLWNRFVDLLNGRIGNKVQKERAGRIKYIIINGDLVDGIGIYPSQQNDLIISDIYQQFSKAAELLSEIPEYIKIIYSSGNHEPVRNAIPRPAVPKKYSGELMNMDITCIGNPSIVQTHGVNTLVFHGDSILDMNMLVPGLDNNKPAETMKELLKCRHLAPIYGKKTQIAPTSKDWLTIDKIPDIFHTGHMHINDMGSYNKILLVNSGCFQSQTDFMKSLGIHPTPGILSIIDLDTLKGTQLDLKSSV